MASRRRRSSGGARRARRRRFDCPATAPFGGWGGRASRALGRVTATGEPAVAPKRIPSPARSARRPARARLVAELGGGGAAIGGGGGGEGQAGFVEDPG